MKPLIIFKEEQEMFSNEITIHSINAITEKVIKTAKVKPENIERHKSTTILTETARIISQMVNARYQNYKYANHFDARINNAFDRILQLTAISATCSTPEMQQKYIQANILKHLYIIAPRNEKFVSFPKLIEFIEHNNQSEMQPTLNFLQ